MTVLEKLTKKLITRGMFESQAQSVMQLAMPQLNELVENYSITFNAPSDEYPDVVYDALFLAIIPIALKWIDDNIPMAWYRDMFL